MDIKINQAARDERREKHVNAIIEAAKVAAYAGRKNFTYSISRDERSEIDGYLPFIIEKRTNGQVRCCSGGYGPHGIKFYINEEVL